MSPPPAPHPPAALGPLVARLRLARGWSQTRLAAELCAAAGVFTLSRHEISRWEREVRVPGRFWRGWLVRILALPGSPPTNDPTAPPTESTARPHHPGASPTGPGARLTGPVPAGRPGTAPGTGGSPRSARRVTAPTGPTRPRPARNTTRRRAGGSSRRTATH
ncbi:helix-turn-helix domain-containing protein [Micromonospora andamanensis]|uniref:Helix-turn-helix domain-containing protein n=1 Tax=Micromonospora andamanensis TaxID=1287068 RepID=A0ABQ4HWQ0_9ACTN|nr:helix-turn-helix transcriptional regulator [Micromonospora andamanensis]GIJ10088.1 hypothetical protein Van01_33020 [Micromonospora andamanensis]